MKNYDGNVIHLNTSGVLFLIVTLAVAMDKRRAVLTEWNELDILMASLSFFEITSILGINYGSII